MLVKFTRINNTTVLFEANSTILVSSRVTGDIEPFRNEKEELPIMLKFNGHQTYLREELLWLFEKRLNDTEVWLELNGDFISHIKKRMFLVIDNIPMHMKFTCYIPYKALRCVFVWIENKRVHEHKVCENIGYGMSQWGLMEPFCLENEVYQEPVVIPIWNTFASSVSGIWKGVGAVFSPITAQMEPIEVGRNNEHQFDCYTLSRIEAVPPTNRDDTSHIRRTVNWVTLNPYGENRQLHSRENKGKEMSVEENASLPTIDSLDGKRKNHDGSYSRGPVDIPVGEVNETNYFLSPTFKFEQGTAKERRRMISQVTTPKSIGLVLPTTNASRYPVMTIRRTVLVRYSYEKQIGRGGKMDGLDKSDVDFDVKPFSQRKRVQPSQLTGSWKVFETSATPIYGEEETVTEDDSNDPPYVYLCTETLKKRNSPDSAVYFGEEEVLDMVDVTMLWLPGGVTAYVDVKKDGILCIGVGWYSDEGINLVMERDYGTDGKLKEVRSKTEVKRRWSEPPPL
uniref:Uncharacterized protein n=1 Tax=Tanacetum cinerariifolium TaxID=118510 RepID=A0A6L2MIX5_TANCI|nr:hypothetical protein [Tanacetum cinerariifolium]